MVTGINRGSVTLTVTPVPLIRLVAITLPPCCSAITLTTYSPIPKCNRLSGFDARTETMESKMLSTMSTHFHVDCLGGLEEFHTRMIPSYANKETLNLAQLRGFTVPKNGFDGRLELKVGQKSVVNEFFGEGHSSDNIVSYVPSERVLFGGCLIKAIGGGKGNLKDANVKEWSNTVRKVKDKFGDAKIIIPGHGNYGGIELLDYTIEKFKVE